MSYAIVGFGEIGQVLAHAFARKNIDVTVASRRQPEALASQSPMRVARWCTHAAALGVSSSSRICSRRSSNR
jgi:predicted dinucleotide-binding enzyme